jgi:hypothetical protein
MRLAAARPSGTGQTAGKRKKGRRTDPFSLLFAPCRTGRRHDKDAIAVFSPRQQAFARFVSETMGKASQRNDGLSAQAWGKMPMFRKIGLA